MDYKIYTNAKKQLIKIWQYTEEKWGEDQANKYVKGLYESLEEIASSRASWRLVDNENIKNIYYYRYKKHFIFYKVLSTSSIGIISILHERMNIPERLKDEKEKP